MTNEVETTKDVLKLLLAAPDSQLDASMVTKLKDLLDSSPDREAMRLGLKDILDLSAHCALASDFVMRILDVEWQRMGGKPGDPVSPAVLAATGMDGAE